MSIKGFDELSKKISQIADNARELSEKKSAAMGDILTPEFVSRHTRFASVDELFKAGGFNVTNQAEFEASSEDSLNSFIRSESTFTSWREMLNTAGAEWAKRELGL